MASQIARSICSPVEFRMDSADFSVPLFVHSSKSLFLCFGEFTLIVGILFENFRGRFYSCIPRSSGMQVNKVYESDFSRKLE